MRRTPRKTRIVGLANLNPTSFDKYLAFCVSLELIEARSGGYYLTPRAAGAMDALDRLIAKSSETDRAVGELRRILGAPPEGTGEELTLRWISRQAWSELVLSLPGDPAPRSPGPLFLPSGARVSTRTSGAWAGSPELLVARAPDGADRSGRVVPVLADSRGLAARRRRRR